MPNIVHFRSDVAECSERGSGVGVTITVQLRYAEVSKKGRDGPAWSTTALAFLALYLLGHRRRQRGLQFTENFSPNDIAQGLQPQQAMRSTRRVAEDFTDRQQYVLGLHVPMQQHSREAPVATIMTDQNTAHAKQGDRGDLTSFQKL